MESEIIIPRNRQKIPITLVVQYGIDEAIINTSIESLTNLFSMSHGSMFSLECFCQRRPDEIKRPWRWMKSEYHFDGEIRNLKLDMAKAKPGYSLNPEALFQDLKQKSPVGFLVVVTYESFDPALMESPQRTQGKSSQSQPLGVALRWSPFGGFAIISVERLFERTWPDLAGGIVSQSQRAETYQGMHIAPAITPSKVSQSEACGQVRTIGLHESAHLMGLGHCESKKGKQQNFCLMEAVQEMSVIPLIGHFGFCRKCLRDLNRSHSIIKRGYEQYLRSLPADHFLE